MKGLKCYGKKIVIEYPVLEGTHGDNEVQLLALHRTSQQSYPVSQNKTQMSGQGMGNKDITSLIQNAEIRPRNN